MSATSETRTAFLYGLHEREEAQQADFVELALQARQILKQCYAKGMTRAETEAELLEKGGFELTYLLDGKEIINGTQATESILKTAAGIPIFWLSHPAEVASTTA
jgi:hypothetical protein